MEFEEQLINASYIFVAVVELVDTADLKSAGLYCEGSSPFGGTRSFMVKLGMNSISLRIDIRRTGKKAIKKKQRKILKRVSPGFTVYIFARITAPIMETNNIIGGYKNGKC